MLFTTTPRHRSIERLMREVPRPKARDGTPVLEQCPSQSWEADFLLTNAHETVSGEEALNRYDSADREVRQENVMIFWDKAHEEAFSDPIVRVNRRNPKVYASLYLLTASPKLWKRVQSQVEKNRISFSGVSLCGCSGIDYILFCCAKDLCLGTSHLDLRDIADPNLLSEKAFCLIQTAMSICRMGRDIAEFERKGEVEQ